MVDKSRWVQITESNPGHSAAYIKRFDDMAAAGADLVGEARFVDTLAKRGSRILDAGCGPGRLGSHLFSLGHEVVGIDVDPILIDNAIQVCPQARWLVGDLAELDLAKQDETEPFDLIFCAGNVMTFLAPSTRRLVLENFASHLAEQGRIAIGFGAGRGYEFSDFFQDVADAGLHVSLRLSTWDLLPLTDDSDFVVAILSK